MKHYPLTIWIRRCQNLHLRKRCKSSLLIPKCHNQQLSSQGPSAVLVSHFLLSHPGLWVHVQPLTFRRHCDNRKLDSSAVLVIYTASPWIVTSTCMACCMAVSSCYCINITGSYSYAQFPFSSM